MAETSAEIVPATATAAVVVEESAVLSEAELRGFAQPSADDHAVDAAHKDQNGTAREDLQGQSSDARVHPAPRAVAPAALLLPRTFLGFTLFTVSGMYIPLATGVFLAVNVTFLGFAYAPSQSVLALPSPCAIVRADVHHLYTLLAVGLVFSVCQVLASTLAKGTLEAQEDARKLLQQQAQSSSRRRQGHQVEVVLCRVMVAAAAACLAVAMVCSIRGLLLAVSVRLGKPPCWTRATKGFLGAGTSVASLLAAYCVAAGLGAAFYAD